MKPIIAIEDVCAWPNLIALPGGELVVILFNRPSHGLEEGGLECWGSKDGGRNWAKKGVASPPEPGQNRMHSAFGQTRREELIVLSTGFELVAGKLGRLHRLWCSRSSDGGLTWEVNKTPGLPVESPLLIPYGKITCLKDEPIFATAYLSEGKGRPSRTWFLQSEDEGENWSVCSQIGDGDTNETTLLRIGEGHWLAAARTHIDHHVELYRSGDDGKTWRQAGPLTLPMQHPADLISLREGVILLTYGLRNRGLFGIGGRISEDAGKTWSPPFVLTQFGDAGDCGYPSSAQMDDGVIVTAYYTDKAPGHDGYHMGVLRWRLDDFIRT